MNEHQPRTWAAKDPARVATVTEKGRSLTYGQLEDGSCQLAQALRSRGMGHGEHLAILLENNVRFHEVYYGVQRSAIVYTPVSTRLTPDEAAYIVDDCGARVVITSAAMGELAEAIVSRTPGVELRLALDGPVPGHQSYDELVGGFPAEPLDEEIEGAPMTYSSGTTGRPKGISRMPAGVPFGAVNPMDFLWGPMSVPEGCVFLVPGPLYHAAPLGWAGGVHRLGGKLVLMEKFDAKRCLELIEEHQVTHGLFVPTMFVRMLKLSDEERSAVDVSSLQAVVHAAAPCPVDVKRQMMAWWGPVIHEFYAGSEGGGVTWARPDEWLAHPGTVGRSLTAPVHIADDDGNELPPGEPGTVWFSDVPKVEYHNAPELSASITNDKGWMTLWDVGYLDDDGFLHLTDRKQFMIVSGGVNIYPQEVENVLIAHPQVLDAAVFGVPNDDMGEEVKAVVQLRDHAAAGHEMASELIEHCRSNMAHYKCPRTVDFEEELPRADNGKLYKRLLRDRYWTDRGASRIL